MLKIKITLSLIFISFISTFAQKSLNDYKYMIVPIEYEFQKGENRYKINALTKFLFEKEGFTVIMSDDNYPVDLSTDHCLALTANLVNNSSMITTKMYFDLVDCNNNKVLTTTIGKSKEKDFEKGYHEAIRKTFEGIKAKNYKYLPKEDAVTVAPVAVVSNPVNVSSTAITKVNTDNKVAEKTDVAVVTTVVAVKKVDKNILYAQEIANGYQLVDSTPKVVYIALKTSMKDVYMIKGFNGTISKKNGVWVAEYYEGDTLIQKELNVKLME
jgi:hypothetical protein